MVVLRHECRVFKDGNGLALWVGSTEGQTTLERINGPSHLAYVVYASTQEDAMQQHHDRQRWGPYVPVPGLTDQPYEIEALRRQLAEYPDDAELRRLNGINP
ncbi:hypothetical protein [Brevundimonas sp.]|jgi:hypothetical protein|uniref:hypothetical protein n=1 Tax=Brevundimonas sp. TaxID=1871086 RepID=UPI0037849D72